MIHSFSNPENRTLQSARAAFESGHETDALQSLQDAVSQARSTGDESFLKATWKTVAALVTGGTQPTAMFRSGKGGGGKGNPKPGGGKGHPRPK